MKNTSEASKRGRRSRTKGAVFEREVAAILSARLKLDVHRGTQTRRGDDAPDLVGLPGFWLELKHHARVSMRAAWEQAQRDVLSHQDRSNTATSTFEAIVPVAVCKDTRHTPLAVLSLDDFIFLVQRLHTAEANPEKSAITDEKSTVFPLKSKR